MHAVGRGEDSPRWSRRSGRRIKDGALTLPAAEIARIEAQFAPPAYRRGRPVPRRRSSPSVSKHRPSRAGCAATSHAHRQPGYAIVTLSLKPDGGIPGRCHRRADGRRGRSGRCLQPTARSACPMSRIWSCPMSGAPICRRCGSGWPRLGLATPNIGLVSDIIACPGLDYCSLANARSIPIAQRLSEPLRRSRRASTRSASSRSRSPAASTPAAIITSAISASSASTRRARNSTRSPWAAAPTRMPASATSSARRSRPTGWSMPSRRSSTPISTRRDEGERFLDTYRRLGQAPFKESSMPLIKAGRAIADPFTPRRRRRAAAGGWRDHRRPGALAGGAGADRAAPRRWVCASKHSDPVEQVAGDLGPSCGRSHWSSPNSTTAAPIARRACCANATATAARCAPPARWCATCFYSCTAAASMPIEVADHDHGGYRRAKCWRELQRWLLSAGGRRPIDRDGAAAWAERKPSRSHNAAVCGCEN